VRKSEMHRFGLGAQIQVIAADVMCQYNGVPA
jgi:hypothetical protein